MGIAPRLFLKKLVSDVLDRIDQFADFDPSQHYQLTLNTSEMTATEREAQATSVDDIELDPVSAFDRLHPALQHHVVNSLGWRDLRPVQSLSIDAYLNGANLVILAPTAGGKTEAAFFPILSQMLTESWTGFTVLYVSPIRALLNNQQERLARYFRLVGRRCCLLARGHAPSGEKADHR